MGITLYNGITIEKTYAWGPFEFIQELVGFNFMLNLHGCNSPIIGKRILHVFVL
jgi:hypothetical protein